MKLDDLSLCFGDIFQVEFPEDDPINAGVRANVKLVGYLAPVSVIVTAPRVDGAFLRLRTGQKMVARLLTNSTVCAFNTHIEVISRQPFVHLHLSFPSDVEVSRVRNAARVAVELPVQIFREDEDEEPVEATIVDLSATGAQLMVESRAAKKDEDISISVDLEVGHINKHLRIPSVVRSRRTTARDEDGRPSAYIYGLEFYELEEQDCLTLWAYVYAQLALRGR